MKESPLRNPKNFQCRKLSFSEEDRLQKRRISLPERKPPDSVPGCRGRQPLRIRKKRDLTPCHAFTQSERRKLDFRRWYCGRENRGSFLRWLGNVGVDVLRRPEKRCRRKRFYTIPRAWNLVCLAPIFHSATCGFKKQSNVYRTVLAKGVAAWYDKVRISAYYFF